MSRANDDNNNNQKDDQISAFYRQQRKFLFIFSLASNDAVLLKLERREDEQLFCSHPSLSLRGGV